MQVCHDLTGFDCSAFWGGFRPVLFVVRGVYCKAGNWSAFFVRYEHQALRLLQSRTPGTNWVVHSNAVHIFVGNGSGGLWSEKLHLSVFVLDEREGTKDLN